MRCPDCQKFVSLEMQDPEVTGLEVTYDEVGHDFNITGSVRIVRACADCGTELKEATLDIEQSVDLGEGVPAVSDDIDVNRLYDAEVEEDGVDIIEEGGGRYAKSYYGATVHLRIVLDDDRVVAAVEWSDKVAASAMDELV